MSQNAVSVEILRKIRHIEIAIRKKVNQIFQGEYRASFKGQGMAFADFREYVPGDDVRRISWIVSARTGKTYVKQFEEERELSVVVLLDVSGSMNFGTGFMTKKDVAVYLGATLAMSAIKNRDLVGLLLFSETTDYWLPPKKGRNQLMRLIRDMVVISGRGRQTRLSAALTFLNKVLKKKSLIFIISDLIAMGEYQNDLSHLTRKHELNVFLVEDGMERELGKQMGWIGLQDLETQDVRWVQFSDYELKKKYASHVEHQKGEAIKVFRSYGVDVVRVPVGPDWDRVLMQFFKKRRA
ncbi:MAG: DUF58 domain-containing protein [Bdellovibrionaceae bacterium]|nr:DUF58 domain-containing protein [Pseudobdellovibrionaceae bacterium]MDW8189615.1 DUF58 domain-containing protein [Pseudobdellovibrionaceae bacterium]